MIELFFSYILFNLSSFPSLFCLAPLLPGFLTPLTLFPLQALYFISDAPSEDRHDLNKTLAMALKVGEVNIRVMEMLDGGHCTRFGSPEPSKVSLIPQEGKVGLIMVFIQYLFFRRT